MIIKKEEIDKKFAKRGKDHIHALSDSFGYKDNINYICNIHNLKWRGELGSVLYKKYSCPECAKDNKIIEKLRKNNLQIKRPDIAILLEHQEDAINIFEYSKDKHWFCCPICGTKLYKSVFNVVRNGLKCNVCSDGFSYPNKYMSCLLRQLNISFIAEYSPEWISPRRYDFYFKINNYEYIVEMDGGLGHGKRVHSKSRVTAEQAIENDLFKDKIAKEHNIQVIRINCDISDNTFISNNIINSDLSLILKLDDVNWEQCDLEANTSKLVKVCELYNKYPFLSYKKMSSIFGLCEDTISKYIKSGSKFGLCKSYSNNGGQPIICIDSKIIFSSCAEAGNYYNIDSNRISRCCQGKLSHACSLHFLYLDDYNGNIDNLIPDYNIKPKRVSDKRPINMYNKQNEFVKSYNSVTDAAFQNKTSLRAIIKSCKSVHKYNYGKSFYYADDVNQPDKSRILYTL